MLEIDEISCAYGGNLALKDVSVSVGAGEVVALIGANGAGKSTLMNCVSGIKNPSKGEIRFLGEKISHLKSHQVVRKGISLVPEGRQIFAPLTTSENLKLGAYHYYGRKKRAEFEDRLSFVFNAFPVLRNRRDQIAGTCSGGEQQMLAIGRALMSGPRLLLLDEPSLGLSPLIVQEIFKVLDQLHGEKLTIFLVEQNARLALAFSYRGYVLEVGKVAYEGSAKELLKDRRIVEAYLGS